MALAKTLAPGSNRDAGIELVFTAVVANTDTEIAFEKGMYIIAWNSGGSSRTVTIKSAPSHAGRLNHISAESIAAGEHRLYGPFNSEGWKQADGNIDVQGSHADVKFGIISPRIAAPA